MVASNYVVFMFKGKGLSGSIVREQAPAEKSLECQKIVKNGIRNALVGFGVSVVAAVGFYKGHELNDWLRVALVPISAGGLMGFMQQMMQASSDQDWVKILGTKEATKEKENILASGEATIIEKGMTEVRKKCDEIIQKNQLHTRFYALASLPFLASAGAIMVAQMMEKIKWDTAALAELPTLPFGALLFYIFWDMKKDSKKLKEELKKLSETPEVRQ